MAAGWQGVVLHFRRFQTDSGGGNGRAGDLINAEGVKLWHWVGRGAASISNQPWHQTLAGYFPSPPVPRTVAIKLARYFGKPLGYLLLCHFELSDAQGIDF
jgi:hypothetical protein